MKKEIKVETIKEINCCDGCGKEFSDKTEALHVDNNEYCAKCFVKFGTIKQETCEHYFMYTINVFDIEKWCSKCYIQYQFNIKESTRQKIWKFLEKEEQENKVIGSNCGGDAISIDFKDESNRVNVESILKAFEIDEKWFCCLEKEIPDNFNFHITSCCSELKDNKEQLQVFKCSAFHPCISDYFFIEITNDHKEKLWEFCKQKGEIK